MKKNKLGKLLVVVVAVMLVFGVMNVAMANTFNITNLGSGGTLWSLTTATHYPSNVAYHFCCLEFKQGTRYTARPYKTTDHSTYICDVIGIDNPDDIGESLWDELYYYNDMVTQWDGEFKFHNGTTTKVVTNGTWSLQ